MEDTTGIIEKIKGMLPFLNEAQRRLYLASEGPIRMYPKTRWCNSAGREVDASEGLLGKYWP